MTCFFFTDDLKGSEEAHQGVWVVEMSSQQRRVEADHVTTSGFS